MLGRALRFVIVGGGTTAVAYVSWILLLKVMSYPFATALSWLLAVGLGFVLNRRFTFGISGPQGRAGDFGLFIVGAVGQLIIGEVATFVTIGRLGMAPNLAFLVTLVLNTSFSFAFNNLVTFRRARLGPATPPMP